MSERLRRWVSGLFTRKQPTKKQLAMQQRTAEEAMQERMLPLPGAGTRVDNPNGSFSTERTIGVNLDGKEYVIPTLLDGVQVSNEEAVQAARTRGLDNYPSFSSPQEAEAFARDRSDKLGQGPTEVPDTNAPHTELPVLPDDDERTPPTANLDAPSEMPPATLPPIAPPPETVRPVPEPRADEDTTPGRPEPLPADDVEEQLAASIELEEIGPPTRSDVELPPGVDVLAQSDESAARNRDPGFRGDFDPGDGGGEGRQLGSAAQGFTPGGSVGGIDSTDDAEQKDTLAKILEIAKKLEESEAKRKEANDTFKETLADLAEKMEGISEAIEQLKEELPGIGALR